MLIRVDGELGVGVTSKDIILHIIGIIGTAGGTGYTIEFAGTAIETLSMEARMSISNMAIEAGARAGMIAPDQVTFDYLKGRPMCPSGEEWDKAVEYWQTLQSDEDAFYDKTVTIDAKDIAPTVTWGTSPQDVAPVTGNVPMIADPGHDAGRQVSGACNRARWRRNDLHGLHRLPLSDRLNILDWRKVRSWKVFRLRRYSLGRARMVVLRICGMLLQSRWDER